LGQCKGHSKKSVPLHLRRGSDCLITIASVSYHPDQRLPVVVTDPLLRGAPLKAVQELLGVPPRRDGHGSGPGLRSPSAKHVLTEVPGLDYRAG